MMNKALKFIEKDPLRLALIKKDAIWSKVYASLLISAVSFSLVRYASLFRFFQIVLSFLWYGVLKVASLLTTDISLPVWALILLLIPLRKYIASAIETITERKQKQISSFNYHDYQSDTFLGVTWRWQYGQGGKVVNLGCFCPFCDYEITVRHTALYDQIQNTILDCDECGHRPQREAFPHDELEDRILKKIRLQLRRKMNQQEEDTFDF